MDIRNYYRTVCDGTPLTLLKRYGELSSIRKGKKVFRAFDFVAGYYVAIKKVSFLHVGSAKQAYREFVIMNTVNHQYIIKLINAFTPQNNVQDFKDLYLVMELFDSNLSKAEKLDHKKQSFLVYQMLRGVNHLHKSKIVHRDLKFRNLAVNFECELKILDFGQARENKLQNVVRTQDMVTVNNRAPELIFRIDYYDEKVDVWSIGCIFAEIIQYGRILFPGDKRQDVWKKIVEILGTPDPEFCMKLEPQDRKYVEQQQVPPKPWKEVFPSIEFPSEYTVENIEYRLTASMARDLLSQMLVVNPERRISIEHALKHPYVSFWHTTHEVDGSSVDPYDVSVELQNYSDDEWKGLLFDKIKHYEATHDIMYQTPTNESGRLLNARGPGRRLSTAQYNLLHL